MEPRDAGPGKETSAFSMINFLIVTVCVQLVLSNGEMIFPECALIQGHVASHHCWLSPTLFLSLSCGEPSGRPDHMPVVLGGTVGRWPNWCPLPTDPSRPLESQALGDHGAPSRLQDRKEGMRSKLTQKLGRAGTSTWSPHLLSCAFSLLGSLTQNQHFVLDL